MNSINEGSQESTGPEKAHASFQIAKAVWMIQGRCLDDPRPLPLGLELGSWSPLHNLSFQCGGCGGSWELPQSRSGWENPAQSLQFSRLKEGPRGVGGWGESGAGADLTHGQAIITQF